MTLTTTATDASFIPNGSTTVFAYPFKIFDKTDLEVFLVDATTGAEILQAVDTDYTVSGVGDATGGNVTMTVAPVLANHSILFIRRRIPRTQILDLILGGDFPSDSGEKRWDRHMMVLQEIEEAIRRCLRFKITSALEDIRVPDLESGKVLQASSASLLAWVDLTTLTPLSVATTAFSRTLLDDPDANTARETLLIPGKNKFINGDFNIWQRGTSFTGLTASTKTADKYEYAVVGAAVVDITRNTNVPTVAESNHLSNFSHFINVTTLDASIAAGDLSLIQQRIEGFNLQTLAQQVFTISFWVKATKTGTYCISVQNTGQDRSFVEEYTINATDTWEYKTIKVLASPVAGTWDYQTGIGFRVLWALAAGTTFHTTKGAWQTGNFLATSAQVNGVDATNNEFRLAQVQIESGSVATQFERRPWPHDLALTQRYFQKTFPFATTPAQNAGTAGVLGTIGSSTGSFFFQWNSPVTMRVNPTLTLFNPSAANSNARNITDNSDTAAGNITNGEQSRTFAESALDATDANDRMVLHITAEAEL